MGGGFRSKSGHWTWLDGIFRSDSTSPASEERVGGTEWNVPRAGNRSDRTDSIARAGWKRAIRNYRAGLVKGARAGQDRRFDLPAVGPETIAAMVEAGAGCLAVEATVTLILDRERTQAAADRAGIACAAFVPDRVGP